MAINTQGTFRRHVPPDLPGLMAYNAQQRGALAAARASGDAAAELAAMTALGHGLFMAGEEAEAAPLLTDALTLARSRGDAKGEIEVLLGLATARQYLGERNAAVAQFEEGIRLCAASGERAQEHFLLHHLGRCLVEMGRIGEARDAFELALALREGLPNAQLAENTRAALDDVAKMAAQPT